MATNRNDNIYIKAGETFKVEVVVRDSDGDLVNLIGATAKFGIRIDAETIIIEDCTIVDSVVTATLADEDTATLDGNYKYEIVLQMASGEIRSLAYGMLIVDVSLISEIFPQGV